jgi:hypothetical protein
MEQEERWISMLKGLNVLPLIVCIFLIYIQGVNLKFGLNVTNVFFSLLLLLSILAYLLGFRMQIEEFKNRTNLIIWSMELTTTLVWLVLFFNIGIIIISENGDIIIEYTIFAFIVGYPLIMLYYNFRLFMNEISKPYKEFSTLTD